MAANFEMPLSRLEEYRGTNPIPDDFNEYWKKALAEMNSGNWDIELVPAKFKIPFAECYHLYFTGVRGARIHAKYIRPNANVKKHPAVLQFHGYTMSSGDWQSKLTYVAAGFSVAALDCRGQGGLSEDAGGFKGNTFKGHIIRGVDDCDPQNMLFRHIFLDTAQLAKIIMSFPEIDENRVGAFGGSQGGGLTIACSALEPRIKKLVPKSPFLSDYKRIWDMDLARDAYEELRAYFRMYDPEHQLEDKFFRKLGYIDVQHLAERIQGEVLMGIGLQDTVCPPSSQFAVYNKIKSRKQTRIYPDFGHEPFPGFDDLIYSFMLGL